MVADDLVSQILTTFVGMVMTKCTHNIPVSASEELRFLYMDLFPAPNNIQLDRYIGWL